MRTEQEDSSGSFICALFFRFDFETADAMTMLPLENDTDDPVIWLGGKHLKNDFLYSGPLIAQSIPPRLVTAVLLNSLTRQKLLP